MIREELLHPAVSHFPIALLVLVGFTKLFQLIVTKKYKELADSLNLISKFLLITGSCFLLPAIFLGDMAFEIVKKDLSNITAAYKHDELAHYTLICFIVAVSIDTLNNVKKFKVQYEFQINIALFIAILVGNYFLFNTAHIGSNLVYEQGAGVLQKK